jgi:hypothetical protein
MPGGPMIVTGNISKGRLDTQLNDVRDVEPTPSKPQPAVKEEAAPRWGPGGERLLSQSPGEMSPVSVRAHSGPELQAVRPAAKRGGSNPNQRKRNPRKSTRKGRELMAGRITTSGDLRKGRLDQFQNDIHPQGEPAGLPNPTKHFEAASFDSVEARISRTHENTRTQTPGTGQAATAPMKESRGIKPVAALAAKGHSPKRGKGQTTPTDEETRRKLSEAGQ